jgi:replicative DNA helicase
MPPCDPTSDEMMLLSAVMRKPEVFKRVTGIVTLSDFSSSRVASVFRCIELCQEKHGTFDASILESMFDLRGGDQRDIGINTIHEAWRYAISGDNADKYAVIVREASLRRSMLSDCISVAKMAEDGAPVADMVAKIRESALAASSVVSSANTTKEIREVISGILDRIESNKGNTSLMGLQTGLYDLDAKTTGFHPGELIIAAARPGMGKTTFALNLMRNMGSSGTPCMMFSLEMTSDNVVSNMLSACGMINGQRFRTSTMDRGELGRLIKASEDLFGAPIFINDASSLRIEEIQSIAYDYHQRHGIKAVIVDYLQLARSRKADGRSREQEVSEISRGLKAMSKDLKIPVIALAQLNREAERRSGSIPMLSDLRESGSIEQDADCVLLLHRPEYYSAGDRPGEIDIIIAKQRNGPPGTITALYRGEYFRIDNMKIDRGEYGE